MAQRLAAVDPVPVAPALLANLDVTGLLQVLDDLLHGALGDANLYSDVAQPYMWIVGDADEHMTMVTEQGPGAAIFHKNRAVSLEKNKNTTIFTGNQFRI